MNDINNDTNLRKAVGRRERQLPPMPADLNERLMKRLQEPDAAKKSRDRRTWLYTIVAVAASILLIIGIRAFMTERAVPQGKIVAKENHGDRLRDSVQNNGSFPMIPSQPIAAADEKPKALRKHKVVMRQRRLQREIPDTLGEGIWQSERNVVRAMQMLGECEAVIQKNEQEVRNNIVRCIYNVMPQPDNVILVTNEAGDCEVIETKNIIEI